MSTLRSRNLVLAAALAIAAALLTTLYVSKARGTTKNVVLPVKTFVATQDIAIGTTGDVILGRHMARIEAVPRGAVVPGALASGAQVAGLVATDPIYKGEQLSIRRFQNGKAQGVRAKLIGTLRAIQVPGDPNQLLAGTLRDGDRVDVVASIADPSSATQGRLTRIVLRGILVLKAPEAKSGWTGPQSASATLQVTDRQAQRLFFVLKNADWSLMLRPLVRPANNVPTTDSAVTVLRGQ
jgi:Flp pilus assembly protein CpaB